MYLTLQQVCHLAGNLTRDSRIIQNTKLSVLVASGLLCTRDSLLVYLRVTRICCMHI